MYLLGFDIGSSSIKAAIVDARTRTVTGSVQVPDPEMDMIAIHPGWAEQDPEMWWQNACLAVQQLLQRTGINPAEVAAIGISYQMHGLVTINRHGEALRSAIIWCDSRAVDIGNQAFSAIGTDYCLKHYLNSPGNFTASKLKWVQDHEPELYHQIWKILLPGDYIAYRLTGEPLTTVSGLSEGILWDFKENNLAHRLLHHYDISADLIPDRAPTFGMQGRLTPMAAAALGLPAGVPVTYRAGDQPNNALALNVLQPGEVAATGGTSGVVYGVVDHLVSDPQNRINGFAHVNHHPDNPRIGALLCINGAGSAYRWLRSQMADSGTSYADMEQLAATAPPGSDGLCFLPFGNGAERMLGNRTIGAQLHGIDFNRHTRAHQYRATLEGIAFSFVYGMQVLQELGLNLSVLRVGNDNLFQSAIFSNTIARLLGCRIEMLRTTGAVGAAIASGVGIGLWADVRQGLGGLESVKVYEPEEWKGGAEAYENWVQHL